MTWARGIEESEDAKEERKIVLKRANTGVLQQRRGPWERRRVQGEADRCHKARSATPLRFGDDAAPPGAASRGLRSGRRGASERSGGCPPRYSSEAECWEQAHLRRPTRVAGVSGSRGLADARPSGECRRRSDPEIPRSRGLVTGRRPMVSRTPSRSVARSGSVDNVIWSSGSGGEGRTGSSPAAPGSVEREPARGGRAAFARDKKKNPEQIGKEAGRTQDGGGATPRKISSGTSRPEEVRKARARESETSRRGRRSGFIGVRGPEGLIGRGAPGQGTAAPRRLHGEVLGSHGNPGGWGNPFKAETRTEQSRAAVVLRCRENHRSPSGRWVRYRLHELVGKKCFCHCSLDEVCHVDEVLKVMDDEQRARTRDDRPPDLVGMSLAEVECRSVFPQSVKKASPDVDFYNVSTYQCSILFNNKGSFKRKSDFRKAEK